MKPGLEVIIANKKVPLRLALGIVFFAVYKILRRLFQPARVFLPERFPVTDFLEWADENCKAPIHSDMLHVDFHRDKTLWEIFRRLLASWVSTYSERLALALVPETTQPPLFKYKHPKLDPAFIQGLRDEAARKHAANGNKTHLFFTGATGFIGHEFLYQVATDEAFAEVTCLIWDKEMAGRTSDQFRDFILGRLPIDRSNYGKYRFIPGDVSKDKFGMDPETYEFIASNVSHLLHCAASVSFEDPYDKSYHNNVVGARNACIFAETIQNHPKSKFVSLVLIETCYIAGRQPGRCREDHLEFPPGYFNNYYEVSKAFASIEGEKRLASGLRLTQLCPAIVIGRAEDGVNHGDSKVCNAPINAFGRIHMEDLAAQTGHLSFFERLKETATSHVVRHYPADMNSSLDLVCVDRVVQGMRAALTKPEAVGHRVQLATHPDHQVRIGTISHLMHQEIGVRVRFVNPVIHRWIRDPAIAAVLNFMQMGKAVPVLRKLTQIFAAYSEWGQPRHEVGNDENILGLGPRPCLSKALTAVIRHNMFVQEFGKVRGEAVFQRERVWEQFVKKLENKYGCKMLADVPTAAFRSEVAAFTEEVKNMKQASKAPKPPAAPQPPSKL